jgi:hypothetical protein
VTHDHCTADKSLYVTAALGYVWAHAVNTRIVLEFKDMGLLLDEGGMVQAEGLEKRCLTVAKSPLAPVRSYPYAIDASGINLQGDAEEGDLTASQVELRPLSLPGATQVPD